ncbi:MAG: ABC transporter substrate-binding protein, partial [Desulfobacterales bacterium]|nr:ABC transporter substrate-binding protein [Desulfobacterales bacterium]
MRGQPKFSIGYMRIVDHLIIGVAKEILARQKERIDLSTFDLQVCHSWNQMSNLLTCGTINGAFITIPMAMDLYAKGLDIRLLMFTHRGGSMIVKNNHPAVAQIKDFAGRSVLIPNALSTQHMLLHRLLASAGLLLGNPDNPEASVYREPVSPYLMPEMLQQDTDHDI